jgi:D-lactate dehydrogenase (cytochrome)
VPDHSLRARRPAGAAGRAEPARDPDVLASYLEDAAHFSGGHARELVTPASEAELAGVLHASRTVLPVGAQSSLTGGATPMGETILSTRRLAGIELVGVDRVRVGAGVTLEALNHALESAGRLYPPSPTFSGAFVGGTVATNAAGAATFKYGTTRDWVEALTVVLPSGDVLDIERGATRASDGRFELQLASGPITVPVPTYRMPPVAKLSAGYFAAAGMDLIDLFIGSEGTLGIVTAVTLRVLPVRPAMCVALVPVSTDADALTLARALREAAHATWRTPNPRDVDVAAIEYMDARSLEIVREDRADTANRVRLPPGAGAALLVTLELPPGTDAAAAFDQIGRARDANRPDAPLVKFCAMLADAGAFDDVEIAVPGDEARMAQLVAVREAVPAGVNRRVGRAKRDVDASIEKAAADVAVPFDRLDDLLAAARGHASSRGLDLAVWGHVSDGNLHPNVIARTREEWLAAREVVTDLGRMAIRAGGAPMAEHGVGRNPIKQRLLRELYGEAGVDEMRAVKQAIDPDWKLSPGVVFPRFSRTADRR